MSHTDKTDPFWVRIRTRYYASEPWHRHRGDEVDKCDLPPLEEYDGTSHCSWVFVWTGRRVCACKMCSGWWWWSDEHPRRQRYVTKLETKRWAEEFNANGDIEEW